MKIKMDNENKNSTTIRVWIGFEELIKKKKKRFNKRHNIEPSTVETTKIITEKIKSAGGLSV